MTLSDGSEATVGTRVLVPWKLRGVRKHTKSRKRKSGSDYGHIVNIHRSGDTVDVQWESAGVTWQPVAYDVGVETIRSVSSALVKSKAKKARH